MIGRRRGFPQSMIPPHSPAMTMIGAGMLWVGWFGFNGGSALYANDDAAAAIINTHAAACTAALVWLMIEKFTVGKPTSVGFATGAVAGLATITPAAGFVSPGAAIVFGIAAAGLCYPAIQLVKQKLQIDDSLDVFAVHGIGGMTGSLLLSVFLADGLGGTGYAEGMSMGSQLVAQFTGVVVVLFWSAIVTAILAVAVSVLVPMRVSEDAEREGLDITSHGERAWEMD
jgi:Amt family ammonium transporter